MRQDRRDAVRRLAHVENFEQRLTFSATPWAEPTDAAPPLEQFGQLDQTPDFVLNETLAGEGDGLTPFLADAHNLTGVELVHDMGLDGSGQTVVVIDSGVAWDHEALGGGFGAGHKIVGGWDFTENDANPYDDGPRGFHGTHVAGILGSDDTRHTGVAPGADIVALRVFNDAGEGMFSWVEDALSWVHENQDAFDNPITTVNLSLGANWNADTLPSWAMLEDELAQLENDGIFVAVAAGNSFSVYNEKGLAYPAVSPHVVPVSSVDDADVLSSFAQRSERALLAPGQRIMSTIPDHATTAKDGVVDDFGVASGTSMASPYVAGSALLVRQAMEQAGYQSITQDTIYDHLRATADPVYDSVTDTTYFRIDVLNAVQSLVAHDDYGDTASAAHGLGAVESQVQVAGQFETTTDVDYFSFTASQSGTATISSTGVQTSWTGLPGSAVVQNGAVTFEVAENQLVTFAVAAGSATGAYALDVQLENASTAKSLGRVEMIQLADQAVQGESRFEVTTARYGILAAQADTGLTVELWKDGQRWASGAGAAQTVVGSGEIWQVRVTGHSASYGLDIANQVAVSGSQVSVYGTEGADEVQWNATLGQLRVNGVDYGVQGRHFMVFGGGGDDRIEVNGGIWNGMIDPSVAQLSGAGSVYATGFETVEVNADGGSIALAGSSANDQATIAPQAVSLSGAGYQFSANGFHSMVTSGMGGEDTVVLYDSAADDEFFGREGFVIMRGGYYATAASFEQVTAHAIHGGQDRAMVYDSAGDDLYTANHEQIQMQTARTTTTAIGFERGYGTATEGYDKAVFEDSTGNDRLKSVNHNTHMWGDNYFVHAANFDRVDAKASHGGDDLATMYDSIGDDRFTAMPGYATMRGDGFYNAVNGFETVYAFAHNGGTDRAEIYDGVGDDLLQASSYGIKLTSDNSILAARRFEAYSAHSVSGGNDTGVLANDWKQIHQSGSYYALDGASATGEINGFAMSVPQIVTAAPLMSTAAVEVFSSLPVVDRAGVDQNDAHQARVDLFANNALLEEVDAVAETMAASAEDHDAALEGEDGWQVDLDLDELF